MQQSELFKWPRGHYIIEESLSGRCQSLSTSRCGNVARELWQEESLQAHTCKLSSCSVERSGQRVCAGMDDRSIDGSRGRPRIEMGGDDFSECLSSEGLGQIGLRSR